MSRYDSLAEQMQEDYKSIMLAFTVTRDAMSVMNKQIVRAYKHITRAQKSMQSMHKTVMKILVVHREEVSRLDDLERRVNRLEDRPPAA